MSVYAAVVATALQFAGCPPSILDQQSLAKPVPAQWSVEVSPGRRHLARVVVYDGPPAQLKIVDGIEHGQRWTEWRPGEADVWVECRYKDSGIMLARNLGKVKSCLLVPRGSGASFDCSN